jgi:transposase
MTHDYKRHGTTTLFAALNVLDGSVIGRNMQRHRHQEFIRFLNAIEAQVPVRKEIHAIVDNYATHKHPKVRQWLARHPRWTFHFTPTSASWLNAVEGFFAKLTKRRLKRGVFISVVDLQAAINRFVIEHNAEPKPFTWTADPDKIIQAVRRGHQVLDSNHSLMIADNGLWHMKWPADCDRRQRHLYDGYAVQEAGLKRRSTISHSRVEPHDLASFGAASV